MSKTKRECISKRLRFEVFKRDSFTCQYCGRQAPDVILNVDHIQPVAGGGGANIVNLITSCFDCNSGKSDKVLSDQTASKKRKAQLNLLQERREQIEMMAEWQMGLIDLDETAATECASLWRQLTGGYCFTDSGSSNLRQHIRKFGVADVMAAMRIAMKYFTVTHDGRFTSASVTEGWSKIGGICVILRRTRQDPETREVYQLRVFLRNRMECEAGSQDDGEILGGIYRLRSAGYALSEIRSKLMEVEDHWTFLKVVEKLAEKA